MEYRAQNALFGKRDILADVFDEVFHIFTLRFVIHGAGVVDDWQAEARDGGFDVVFLDVDKRADERYARFVHISGGSKAGKATFVQQRQQHCFGNVVCVVSEGKFASAEADYLVVECASAHFGAKGARILLFACIEYDFADIRLYEVVFYAEAVAVGDKGVHFLLFGVFKPHIHGYGLEVIVLGREASIRRKRAQKQGAVLSARQSHEYFVAVVNHIVILHGSAHCAQYFLHKSTARKYNLFDKIILKGVANGKRNKPNRLDIICAIPYTLYEQRGVKDYDSRPYQPNQPSHRQPLSDVVRHLDYSYRRAERGDFDDAVYVSERNYTGVFAWYALLRCRFDHRHFAAYFAHKTVIAQTSPLQVVFQNR